MAGNPQNHQAGRPCVPDDIVFIEDMRFDNFEISVLRIARHFFESLDQPKSQAWKSGFLQAEHIFSIPFGASIAHAISIAIDMMCLGRIRSFSYFATSHPKARLTMTNEEKYFLMTLQSIRLQRKSSILSYAVMVCEGPNVRDFLSALERLAIITGDVQSPAYAPL